MSDMTRHLANQLLYRLNAKVNAAAHPAPASHLDAAQAPRIKLPRHVLDHAIDYIDKIKVAKSVIK